MSAASQLTLVNNAIDSLLIAVADDATQSYSYNGRTWERANFPALLDSLHRSRAILQREVSRQSSGQIFLGTLQ